MVVHLDQFSQGWVRVASAWKSTYFEGARARGEWEEVSVRVPRRFLSRFVRLGVVGGVLLVGASLERAAVAPAPRKSVRVVELICQPGWRGGAGGQYGGVPFDVFCQNGRGRARVEGFTSNAYTARMGVEGPAVAADCLFSGDAASAEHACAEVVLSIH